MNCHPYDEHPNERRHQEIPLVCLWIQGRRRKKITKNQGYDDLEEFYLLNNEGATPSAQL
jgi:hypothetical protein